MTTRTAGNVASEHLRDPWVEHVLELPGHGSASTRTVHARADSHPSLIQTHPEAVRPARSGRVPVLMIAGLLPGRRS